nr:hypothetical protein [Bacillus velezensis]
MPGLAYIDLIYQTFRENGFFHAGLELRHLSIFHPLAPEQGESILLSVDCTENGEEQWKVEVKGQKQGDEASRDKGICRGANAFRQARRLPRERPDGCRKTNGGRNTA